MLFWMLYPNLDLDSFKIQDNREEALKILSISEKNSISNNKLIFPMHTALIFKEQTTSKRQVIKRKRLVELLFEQSCRKADYKRWIVHKWRLRPER
jgi:hypothetical protein